MKLTCAISQWPPTRICRFVLHPYQNTSALWPRFMFYLFPMPVAVQKGAHPSALCLHTCLNTPSWTPASNQLQNDVVVVAGVLSQWNWNTCIFTPWWCCHDDDDDDGGDLAMLRGKKTIGVDGLKQTLRMSCRKLITNINTRPTWHELNWFLHENSWQAYPESTLSFCLVARSLRHMMHMVWLNLHSSIVVNPRP